ncbi:serine/threonine protein kinase [Paenarthrobacter nitroguajacolicus]|uniref:serine/threonine-protein kinase n=1 Tax=Paenarthrobacter TaxID=1742992 RepID=UPI00286479E7|nr:serine/threonine-protein kinase [Paenarthrobacter nitroguajacolicus]MDR6988378.1 serine/threonine protein kinase [Paenarthrobacter nitroguajacolicus]
MTTLDVAAVRADRGAVGASAAHAGVVHSGGAHALAAPAVAARAGAVPPERVQQDVVLGGRYRLGERLGGGSEAYVNQALDLRTGVPVAVKIFRATDPAKDAPFRREVEIHSRLRHPNIVRVLDSEAVVADDPERSRNYLVMDLVGGNDLRSILHHQPASPEQTVAWMSGIAKALTHLHRRGIVHNDIKPGNILVDFGADPDGPGIAKLTDFGIAIDGRHAAPKSSSGTPHYLSPEEVCGGTSTSASDIYSLGLVALECLTGTKAFPGPPLESMVARTLGEPRIPGTVRRRWSMVLHAMTDPEPAGRPSASQAVGMLRRLVW